MSAQDDATAQEVPKVIRELQAAREAKWAEASGMPAEDVPRSGLMAGLMALAAEETFEATSALRQELAQAKAENERLRMRHHEKCFQRRPEGIPDGLPDDICDCRILWTLQGAEAAESRAQTAEAAVTRVESLAEGWERARRKEVDQNDFPGKLIRQATINGAAALRATLGQGGPLTYVDSPCPSCGRTDQPTDRFHVCPPGAALAAESTPAAEPHAEDGAVPLHLDPSLVTNMEGDEGQMRRTKARMQALIDSWQAVGPAPVADPDDTKDGRG